MRLSVALSVALISCGVQAPDNNGAPRAESTAPSTSDESFLTEQIRLLGSPQQGAIVLTIADSDGIVKASVPEATKGRSLAPDEQFRIWSVTKAFTAALVMTLVDDQLVDLDDEAGRHMKSLDLPNSVTLRDLMGHTSGIPNFTDVSAYAEHYATSKEWSPLELYGLVADLPLEFEPGSEFSYSNTNYLLLGVLIEDVTGVPYAEALRGRILDPLGLISTYLAHYEKGHPPASGYTSFGQAPGAVAPVDLDYTSIETAAWAGGGLISSVSDLHAFFTALIQGQVISAGLIEEMTLGDEYGLGLEIFDSSGQVIGHRGGDLGSRVMVIHSAASSRTAVFLSTNDSFDFTTLINPTVAYFGG